MYKQKRVQDSWGTILKIITTQLYKLFENKAEEKQDDKKNVC